MAKNLVPKNPVTKNLVIVESPAKVKTIKKFLGKNYEVMASNGHVRDLPKSQLGIDVEDTFEPKYITIRGKGELLAALRKEVKKADKIYLATDPDREGEAISWHLYHALKLEEKDVSRISFNEITKNAVKESLKHPRDIDMNLVDAQQARRVLDRLVGYKISPLLWAKVKRGLSAGRVQSVALRIICDREEEISAFIPEEYWSLEVTLKQENSKNTITAKLTDKLTDTGSEKISVSSEKEMKQILSDLENCEYVISEIKKGKREKKAPLPFTTSTLQQEASKALNFPIAKTMRIAQQLYEGVDVKGYGTVGLITYLRTDSVRISEEADAAARDFIGKTYGEQYLYAGNGRKAAKNSEQKIQDAHEAIRPSDINRTPALVKESLDRDQFRLYQLIWKRFAASRMANAEYETTSVSIHAGNYGFRASALNVAFDGYMSVYTEADEEKTTRQAKLNALESGSRMQVEQMDPKQHFTQPPAHYTEATLVKALEELGIGRPSTYAPTITVILARRYVSKEGRNLFVTEIGEVVNSIMKESFPTIVDDQFTATMESLLDGVADGIVNWKMVVSNFYPDLQAAVDAAETDLEKVEIHDEETDVECPNCGRRMVIKYGPFGKFLACPGFPDCRTTLPYYEKIGVMCPKCGGDLVIRKTQKGRRYYGCINSPECDFMSWGRPVAEKCPRCGGYMVVKGRKYACADEKCGYVSDPADKEEE